MSYRSVETGAVRRSLRLKAVAVAVLASTGCSMMQPYEHLTSPPDPVGMPTMRLAGGAEQGLGEAERMRQRFFYNLENRSMVRNTTGVVAGVLSGWAIYNAVRPGDSAGSDGALRRSLRLGAVLGTLYGFRELFVNPEHESIYAEGYRAMTCLMLQSAPLLMTESTLSLTWPSSPSLPPYPIGGAGDRDQLRFALDELERRILQVNVAAATLKAEADVQAAGNEDMLRAQAGLRYQIVQAENALYYARNALSDGRTLARTIDGAGRLIRERVAVIVGAVNDQLQQKQNNFKAAASTLKDAQDIAGGVTGLGSTTAVDQTNMMDTGPTSMSGRGILLAGPMSALSDLLATPDDARARVDLLAAAPVPAAAASAPAKKKAAAPAPAPAASTPLSLEELKIYRDAVDAAIKSAQQRAEKAAEEKKQQALKKREEDIDKIARTAVVRWSAEVKNLAHTTEELYAARRPVVQELQNFRRRTREATATTECRELAPLRVSPTDVRRAYRGDTVSYLISQREAGLNPVVALHGPLDDKAEKGIQLGTEAIGATNLHRVTLKIGTSMPKQTVRLVITDGRGVATQEVTILAGGAIGREASATADKPAATASSPKPAASAAGGS